MHHKTAHPTRAAALAGAAAVLALLVARSALAEDKSYADWRGEAIAAYQAEDFEALRGAVEGALTVRPNYPNMLYNLAVVHALLGDGNAAVGQLERLADMGLAFDLKNDPSFAGLADEPGFRRVTDRYARNLAPRGNAETAFVLTRVDFIPEGIAFDPRAGRFYVGSIRTGRIVSLNPQRDRQPRPFAEGAQGGPWSIFGMQADAATRTLWVASSAAPQHESLPEGDRGRTGIFVYALDSGQLVKHFDFPRDDTEHVLGDLVLAGDGTVFTSDSAGGGVYRLAPDAGDFVRVVAPGRLGSPQGLVLTEDEKRLYVADYTGGLFLLDRASGVLRGVTGPKNESLYGIDGLYRHDGDLIAIQNGTLPHRVLRLRLNKKGNAVRAVEVIVSNLPQFDEPTLGVVVDNAFYFVANSQWNRFGAGNVLPPLEELQVPVILRADL